MAPEVFADYALTTVSSGGTDAPAAGTVQTWTFASWAAFPAVTAGSTQLHIGDPAKPSETILVRNVTGTTGTVTRGADGTTPVAHSAGFTVKQVITAGWLGSVVTGLPPSGDTTGATDPVNIQALINLTGKAQLQPGKFYMGGSSALALSSAGAIVQGSGIGTQLVIASGFSAAEVVSIAAASCEVRDLAIVGASSTITSNPACNGIELNGYQHCRIQNIWGQYVNGWLVESAGGSSTANLDTMIGRIVARTCAAGVHVKGVTGSGFQGEQFLTDIQLQQMGATSGPNANLPALLVQDCSDVLIQGLNVGMASSVTSGALVIEGACSTVAVTNADVGSNAISGGSPAIYVTSTANGSPSGVTINGGSAEGGLCAAEVAAGSDITLNGLRMHAAYGSGLVVTGTPGVLATGCTLTSNNQGGGTAYDVDCSGMTGGALLVTGTRFETTIGTGTPGEIPQSVNASVHAYFKGCYFLATNSASSNVFNGTPQQVTDCAGYNPHGPVTAPSVGTSPFTPNGYQSPLMVIFTAINGMTEFDISGTAVPLPVAGVPYVLGVREPMTVTWTGTAPTWAWWGL